MSTSTNQTTDQVKDLRDQLETWKVNFQTADLAKQGLSNQLHESVTAEKKTREQLRSVVADKERQAKKQEGEWQRWKNELNDKLERVQKARDAQAKNLRDLLQKSNVESSLPFLISRPMHRGTCKRLLTRKTN